MAKLRYPYRSLSVIAADISADWENVYFGAKPYLDAMYQLNSMNDKFFFDDATTIVLYFLGNASTWRGETARHIKKELNDMLKNK